MYVRNNTILYTHTYIVQVEWSTTTASSLSLITRVTCVMLVCVCDVDSYVLEFSTSQKGVPIQRAPALCGVWESSGKPYPRLCNARCRGPNTGAPQEMELITIER